MDKPRKITAWVQVEIDVDEYVLGSQKMSDFITEAVEEGASYVVMVYRSDWSSGKAKRPEVKCACGTKLDDLNDECWGCHPEEDEVFCLDHVSRGRDVVAELEAV